MHISKSPDKRLMKSFITLFTLVLLVGCSTKPTETEFKLSIGNLVVGGETGGGIGIWAENTTTGEKFGNTFAGGANSVDVPYPPGIYNFVFVVWDGDTDNSGAINGNEPESMTGEVSCAQLTGLNVGGASMVVDITLNNANCDSAVISKAPSFPSSSAPPYFTNPDAKSVNIGGTNKFPGITLHFCKDFYTGATGNTILVAPGPCAHPENSEINVKVTLMNHSNAIGAQPGISSVCFIGTATGQVDMSSLNLPMGSTFAPIMTFIEVFSNDTSDDCIDNEPMIEYGPPSYSAYLYPDGFGQPKTALTPQLMYLGTTSDATRDIHVAFNEIGAGLSVFRDQKPFAQCNGGDCVIDSGKTYAAIVTDDAGIDGPANSRVYIPAEAFGFDPAGVTGGAGGGCTVTPVVTGTNTPTLAFANNGGPTWDGENCHFEIVESGANNSEQESMDGTYKFTVNFTSEGTTPDLYVYVRESSGSWFYSANEIKKRIWDLTGNSSETSPHKEFCMGGDSYCFYSNGQKDNTYMGELRRELSADGLGGLLFKKAQQNGIPVTECADIASFTPFTVWEQIEDEGYFKSLTLEVSDGIESRPPFMSPGTGTFNVRIRVIEDGVPVEIVELDCAAPTNQTHIFQRASFSYNNNYHSENADFSLYVKAQDNIGGSGDIEIELAEEYYMEELDSSGSSVLVKREGRELSKFKYDGTEYIGKTTQYYSESKRDEQVPPKYDTRMGISKFGYAGKGGSSDIFTFYFYDNNIDGDQDLANHTIDGDFCLDSSCTNAFGITGGDEAIGTFAPPNDQTIAGTNYYKSNGLRKVANAGISANFQTPCSTTEFECLKPEALGASSTVDDFSFDCVVNDTCSSTQNFDDFIGPAP